MEDRISEYLHVPSESLRGVNYSILRTLCKKIDKFELSEEEVTRLNVLIDEIKSQYYTRISKLNEILAKSSEEKNVSNKESDRLHSLLKNERSKCARKIDALNKQLNASKDTIKKLDDERGMKEEAAVSQAERENDDPARNALSNENKLLRRKLLEMENILQTCKSNTLSLKLKYETVSQEKDLILQNKKWIQEQLSFRDEKTLVDEVTKTVHVQNLEEKLNRIQNDYESVSTNNLFLVAQNKQLSHSMGEKILEIKNLKDTVNIEKAEFSKEMTLQKNMNDLLRSQLTSLERNYSLRTIEKDNDDPCKNPEHSNVIDELIDTKLKLEKSKYQCQRLQDIVADCIEKNGAAFDNTHIADPSVSGLVSDIKNLKRQLIKERNQKFQLQNQMESFIMELERKTPELISFKKRTELLEHELKHSTDLLETISLAKRKDEKELISLRQKLNNCESNIHLLVKQRLDLARQVKLLLLNISAVQKSASPLSNDELISLKKLLESQDVPNEKDSQTIITERLVEFNNTNELQEKNMELLNCVRVLADKLENYEGKQDKSLAKLENRTIKEAKDAIIELEHVNSTLESRINILSRERDSYKLLTSANGNKDHADAAKITEAVHLKIIKALEAELSLTKIENSAVVQKLNKELLTCKKLQSDGQISLQELSNFKILAIEKENLLQTRIDDLKTKLEKQRSSGPSSTQGSIGSEETKVSQYKNKIESLMCEISNLTKKTIDLGCMKESLTRDLERCCKEKMQLQMKLTKSETSQNEQKLKSDSKQVQYDTIIKELEKSCQELNNRLLLKVQEIETLQTSKNSQLKWAQNTIDETEKNMKLVSADLTEKKTTIRKLSSEMKDIENELQKTKLQYKFLNNISDVNTLEMALKKELERTQIELKDAHSQIETYEEIISTDENALKELNDQLTKTKEELRVKTQSLDKEKNAREEESSFLRRELDEFRGLQPKLKEGALRLVQQSEKLSNQTQKIQAMNKKIDKMTTIVQVYQKEQTSQHQSELKANEDLSALVLRLENEVIDYQTELKKTKSSLHSTQELLDKHERKWMEEKADYERELISNIEQTESLRVENSVLVENMDDGTGESNGDKDYLRLVSLFSSLRHERNTLETKLTTCKRDLALAKQKNANLEKTVNDMQKTHPISRKDVQCSTEIIDEFEDIMKEITQVNILKENNTILQKSLERVTERNEAIYKEYTNLQHELSRLQGELVQTKEQISVNANKVLVYESEIEQWKQRFHSLSQQQKEAHKEETEKLFNEISDMKAKLLNAQNANADLNDKFNRLKKQAHEKLDASKKQQTALTNELDELKDMRNELEESLRSEESKVLELEAKLKKHGVQAEGVSKNQEDDTSNPLIEEIQLLKRELQVFKETSDSSDIIERMKEIMEAEKAKTIEEKATEFERKLEEITGKNSGGKVDNGENIEELKKQWLKQYEEETVRRIKEAEENLKKRIRLPSEERIQKIISKRKEELEQEFQRKLEENSGCFTLSSNKKENEISVEDELWNSPSKGNSEKPSIVTKLIKQKNSILQEQLKNAKNGLISNDSRPASSNKENDIPDNTAADNKVPSAFNFGKPLFPSNISSFRSFKNPFTPAATSFNTGVSLPAFSIQPAFAVDATVDTAGPNDDNNNEAKIIEIENNSLKRPIDGEVPSDTDSKKIKESSDND
ncbi:hypothetical protein GRS66_008330 [Saccharomyces pastorianus]|uniref:NUA/TPR/MLP1-2-like domain-containing protein n=1 Tax=Saccharomyces pastorianus TaxID=27292 RepID=A0A6C1E9B7_SACPS|nr:hypothetical protein GRS66_008330 [Saccharomyces pastorianus]